MYMTKNSINQNNTEQWEKDIRESVNSYNDWFLDFAPSTFIEARKEARELVELVFQQTKGLEQLSISMLKAVPKATTILRMITTPPLARDRLGGLSGVSKSFIEKLEERKWEDGPLQGNSFDEDLEHIVKVIKDYLDLELVPWLDKVDFSDESAARLAKDIIIDRVCSAIANPRIRNEQENRQKKMIQIFLEGKGYKFVEKSSIDSAKSMKKGTFTFGLDVPVKKDNNGNFRHMPIDVVIKRKNKKEPLLIECKSAGDEANTNKRRKEEATKMNQLRETYGNDVEFVLFLGGYFGKSYLEYEAKAGIDWIWEHRIEDFMKAGV